MIEFDAVTKVYPGGTVAVENLSLIAPTGRITVVVGPAGCGKTTLLRMVNRLVDPSAGRVLIDGAANTLLRRSALRRSIGYVIAKGGLFPHRTVVENIETVPLLIGTKPRQARELAHALLERVGLSVSFAEKFPGQLSTGQQLRVALARALAADPPVLLMDEPFSTLDPVVRGDLQDDLLDLQQAAPKTILFVTHDIDEAIKLGDQIAVMDTGGRLVQIATPETLLVHPGTDFVADFLGRDRGIRKLAFLPVSDLPLAPAATVQAGATGDRAKAISTQHHQDWLLVLDPERHPRGWVDTSKLGAADVVSGQVVYPLGGTFYPDESVLAALDAAILSPPGLAVCVDDDGLVQGVVSHGDIARYLAARGPSTLPSRLGGPAVSAAPAPAQAHTPTLAPAADRAPAPEAKAAPEPKPAAAPQAAKAAPAPDVGPAPAPAAPSAAKPAAQQPPQQQPPQQQPPQQSAPPEAPTVEVMRTPPASVHPVAPPPGEPAAPKPAAQPAPKPAPQSAPQPAPQAAPTAKPAPQQTPQQKPQPIPERRPVPPPTQVAPTAPAPPVAKPAHGPEVSAPQVAPQQSAPPTPAPAEARPAASEPAHAAPAQSPAAAAAAAAGSEDDDLDSGRWEWDPSAGRWVRVPDSGS